MKGSKASGKTETLKELGKLIGNYVLIINCSENLTHFSLVRMLSGLAQVRNHMFLIFYGFFFPYLILKGKL